MKVKTSELSGAALDWAVAIAEGHKPPLLRILRGEVALPREDDPMWCDYLEYSTDWAQGGPIIEREGISWHCGNKSSWHAYGYGSAENFSGHTPLIAAMRCFCAAKLGDEVDIPEELCPQQSSLKDRGSDA